MARLDNIGKQFFDANGDPLAGGKLYFYASGTSTLATTYSDSALSSANANPVILSADGRMPDVFYAGFLKIVLTDANDVVIETRDPVGFAAGSTGLPAGGTDGQVLTKLSSTDFDVDWETPAGGGGGALWTWDTTVKTVAFTAEVGKYHFVRAATADAEVVVTLPSSPTIGDVTLVRNIRNGTSYVSFDAAFGVTVDGFSPGSNVRISSSDSIEAGTDAFSQTVGLIYLESNAWYSFFGQVISVS